MRATQCGLAVVVAITIAIAGKPRAQCGETTSSCVTCHETEGQRPVLDDATPWHRDHAFGDLCSRCHGGDPLATDATDAHTGTIDPLADPRATCASCHPDDAVVRAARYAITPSTPAPAPSPAPPVAPAAPPHDLAFAIAAALIAIVGGGAVAIVERRASLRSIRAFVTRPSWSAYLAGALLGLVVAISLCVFGRRLSGAGAYQSLSGLVGARVAPHATYWTSIVRTGMTWDAWLLVGTFAGAFASAATSRQLRVRTMPDARWVEAFGPRVIVRWLLVFAGTALLSIAAGIAGGCTAGLVLSGGAVLAPGAFVFMAAMFAGGIPVAWYAARRARRRTP